MVICCPIYRWLEVSREEDISRARSASYIYSMTSDRQSVIYMYCATNHLLARIYFDSNIQKMTKKQMYPSNFSRLLPLNKEIPPIVLSVIRMFTCIALGFDVRKRRYTV